MTVFKTMTNQIEVDKQLFTALSECKSDDETRFFMTEAYYEKAGNRISSTDGRRLFTYNFTEENDLTEGFYIPVKQGKKFFFFHKEDMEGTYPNIDRVVPEDDLITEYKFTFCSQIDKCSRDIYLMFLVSGPININYLKPVHGIPVTCSYTLDPNKAIILSDDSNWQYIIMPMQDTDITKSAEAALLDIHKAKLDN